MSEVGSFCKIASFNYELLDSSILGYIHMYNRTKKVYNQIDGTTAKLLVAGKVARVVSPSSICVLYDKKELNQYIINRDLLKCRYCNKKGNTIDHMVPKSLGGKRTLTNCVCSCRRCNKLKGNKLLVERSDVMEEILKQILIRLDNLATKDDIALINQKLDAITSQARNTGQDTGFNEVATTI
jgi:hypothetical protein